MRGKDPQSLLTVLNIIVAKVKKHKVITLMIGLALLAALIWVFCRKKK
jgi:LPXTG-motif cell wall-anchored protein